MASLIRLDRPTQEELTAAIAQATPFIATGAMERWKALRSWSLEYLREKIGSIAVDVEESQTPVFKPCYQARHYPSVSMTIDEYCDRVLRDDVSDTSDYGRDSSFYYAAHIRMSRVNELRGDVCLPLSLPTKGPRLALWIGPSRTGTHLHYDPFDNIIAVVIGSKQVTLLAPGQYRRLYPYRMFSRWGHFSRVDVEQPDFRMFPRFRDAQVQRHLINAGDLLFIPLGWWHHVVNTRVTVAVNVFFNAPFHRRLCSSMLRFHCLSAFKCYSRILERLETAFVNDGDRRSAHG